MWLSGKESASQCKRHGFIPGLGRYPGIGNGNPFQYSCLKSPTDREAGKLQPMRLQRVGYD